VCNFQMYLKSRNQDVWNNPALKIVEEQGKEAPLFIKYTASKTLAEQAAWQLIRDNNPRFDLVTVLPSYIWGVRTNILFTSELGSLKQRSKLSARPLPISRAPIGFFFVLLGGKNKGTTRATRYLRSCILWMCVMSLNCTWMPLSPHQLGDSVSPVPLRRLPCSISVSLL
jgi:hypothetical protein